MQAPTRPRVSGNRKFLSLFLPSLTAVGILFATPALAVGTVTLGPAAPRTLAVFDATVVTSPGNEIFTNSDLADGVNISSVGEMDVLNGGGETLIQVDGFAAGRSSVVRDEGSFMRYIASANMDMRFTRGVATPSDGQSFEASASAEFEFEITGEAMPVHLSHDFSSLPGVEVSRTVTLSGLYSYSDPPIPFTEQADTSFTTDLPPGTYTVRVAFSWESTNLNPVEFDFAFELSVGEEPENVPFPAQGDYTHPDIFTERDGTGILASVSPQIVSETDLGGGMTEMLVSTLVANTGAAPWPTVQLDLAESVAGEPDITVVAVPAEFPLGPSETTASAVESTLQVATADLPAVRAAILDGSRFRFSGTQQAVFAYPVEVLNEGDFESGNNIPTLVLIPYAPNFSSGTV